MKQKWLGLTIAALVAACSWVGSSLSAADVVTSKAGETVEERDARTQWWRDAKFGVFLCWGPCSIEAAEIGWGRNGPRPGHRTKHASGGVPVERYDNLYKEFNPTKFNAREWVGMIKASGARYMIFLTKHHDGFCLFDSKLTDYTIMNSPFGRDVTAELADACHAAGIKIVWYYSQPDWHHPDYRTENHARYIKYLHGQIRELCTNYGKIDGIWFDGLGGNAADWDSPRLFAMIHELQPGIVINNRGGLPGDFVTPEQKIGRFDIEQPWESCITMGHGWSWRGGKSIRSLDGCLRLLIRCAGGGGNLALDTGPMPDGRIHPGMARNYLDMGTWLGKYGDSIYGTTGGPYRPSDWWGVSTRKGNRLFLHILNRDGDSLVLPSLPKRIRSCRALTGGDASFAVDGDRMTVDLQAATDDGLDTVVVLELEGSALDIPPIVVPPPDCVSAGKACSASGNWSPSYSVEKAFDGDSSTRWGAPPKSRSGWVEVDLGAPTRFDRVAISEAPWNRVQKFELQYRQDGEWRTFLAGMTLGEYRRHFPPITAQNVRLNILEANEVPTIWEIQLLMTKQAD